MPIFFIHWIHTFTHTHSLDLLDYNGVKGGPETLVDAAGAGGSRMVADFIGHKSRTGIVDPTRYFLYEQALILAL